MVEVHSDEDGGDDDDDDMMTMMLLCGSIWMRRPKVSHGSCSRTQCQNIHDDQNSESGDGDLQF